MFNSIGHVGSNIAFLQVVFVFGVCHVEGTFEHYHLHTGWTVDTYINQESLKTAIHCALDSSTSGNAVVAYNKTLSSCITITDVTSSIFLYNTGDNNDLVLLEESGCSQVTHVFKVYQDTDYYVYDYPVGFLCSSIEECITYCDQNYPLYKAIMYKYTPSSSGETCYCKSVTRQQHIDMGFVRSMPEWNYYERLC